MRTIQLVFISLALIILSTVHAANLKKPTISNPIAGKHYEVLDKPGITKAPPGKIEVVDFFWYGCPHCYAQLEYTEDWEKEKPPYVSIRRVPVPYSGLWTVHARAYYTAKRMNVAGRTHRALFDAIHKKKQTLTNQRTLAGFYADRGADFNRFNELFNSFSVDARIKSAQREVALYKIDSVPTFIINGKYKTDVTRAGSKANIMQVIKVLVEQEYQALSQGES